MKNRFLFIAGLLMGFFVIFINVNSLAQTTPSITVSRGQWAIYVVTDTSIHPQKFDTTWFSNPDTIRFPYPVFIHDTIRIHDTTYAQFTIHDTIRIRDTINNSTPPVTTFTGIFTTQTLPTAVTTDGGQGIELGVKFRSSITGYIRGIRFYKVAGNNGTHTGELYLGSGSRLASAVFTGETNSGWQTVTFSSPVAVAAGVTYIASYYSPTGTYSTTLHGFDAAIVNLPLTGLANGTDGSNGVYSYGAAPLLAKSTYQNSNYWVEPIYSPTNK